MSDVNPSENQPPVQPQPPVEAQAPVYGQQPHAGQPPVYGQQQPGYGQPAYGQPQPQQPYFGGAPAAPKTPLLSIFSMVAGIVAFLGSPIVFIPFVGGALGLLVSAAAVVLGFLGKSKEAGAKGFWLTGLILGFVGIGFALLSFVLWGLLITMSNGFEYDYNNNYDY